MWTAFFDSSVKLEKKWGNRMLLFVALKKIAANNKMDTTV